MLAQQRLESLQHKSALIAQRIEKEERAPAFDPIKLRDLKKQKLHIKEVIAGISKEQ